MKNGRKKKIVALLTFVVVLILLGTIVPVVYRHSIMPPSKSMKIYSLVEPPPPYGSGKVRNYFSVGFGIPANSTFHFSASAINSTTFYLMNNHEYVFSGQHNWLPNKCIFYFSAVLNNSGGSFSVPIPQGSWEAVFVNTNLNSSTYVSISSMYWTYNSPASLWKFTY